MNKIQSFYENLLKEYGHQGWWPLLCCEGCNPTKTGSVKGYHPKDYSYPKTDNQRFEICIGAILTQNTSWVNVEKALINLKKLKAINAKALLELKDGDLKRAIKPAGYYNQKARKLKEFSTFYLMLKGKTPLREELLGVWGIGPETADSILLYGYKVASFVIDAYTKRIFSNLGFKENSYDSLKELFEKNLKKDYRIYQEYHALIVEHGKRYLKKEKNCILSDIIC